MSSSDCYMTAKDGSMGFQPMRPRLAVLASGSGTNLQAVLDQIAAGKLAADVAVVISNNSDSVALERARKAGIAAVHW